MPNLPLQTYARLIANLAARRGTPLGEVLSELGLSLEDLKDSEATTLAELAQSWPRRKGIAAMKFATALAEELVKLGPIHLGGTHEAEPEILRPRENEVPSYLREPPAQVPLPAPPTALPKGPSPLAETASMDLSAVVAAVQRGALPFASSSVSRIAAGEASNEGRPPEDADLSSMPLATYAEISGALARGQSREEALAKHGLSAEAFNRLAQGWARRFQEDPALLATFKELAKLSAAAGKKE